MSQSPCARARDAAGTPVCRRSWLAGMLGTLAAWAAWPRWALAAEKPWVAVPLAKAPKLKAVGGSMVTRIRGLELLLVRDGESSAHAFEAKCPHEQCDVGFAAAQNRLECPCHEAVFDLDGKVLQGPVPRPLRTYPVLVDGERILIRIP